MNSFTEAVRATIVAGGCNASRAAFIGACFAAHGSLSSIPDDWIAKTQRAQTVFELAQKLVTHRK